MTLVRAGLHQVITFATDLRSGNPAFVLTEARGATDQALECLRELLHADVLAVIATGAADEPALRFLSSQGAHPGAGHASLAAAHVALHQTPAVARASAGAVTFHMAGGGRLTARETSGRIAIGYPIMPAQRTECVAELAEALGARPAESWVADFGHIGVFGDAGTVASLRPDLTRVAVFDRAAVVATAPGDSSCDIVIRVFAPRVGLPEDPVCGTAHRIIAPYWSERMGKTHLHSRQLSRRGGDLWCETIGGDVTIAGESRLVLAGTVELPTCNAVVQPVR